ncbi:hypothetical protein B0I37DRAFT_447929 [Chaetomium sp. MPI-CAGE-AT-0009]|nr:hypothetical protein B0I37DRAFT_447929 [Chaetomium sp. MPI-CAGE-AT-0009]
MEVNNEHIDEAIVRERLLKERMLAMLPKVRRDCIAGGYRVDVVLSTPPTPAGAEDHDDDDDAVSICSEDIDPNDDFAWYINSRDFLVIDTIPYPERGMNGATLPSYYPEMLLVDFPTHPPPTPLNNDNNTATGPPTIPTLTPEHFHPLDHPADPLAPKHGTHPRCNLTHIKTTFTTELPLYFPDALSLQLVDYDLTLRPEITELPAQGRRWLTGSHNSLFVEVVDPADGTWVSDAEPVGAVEAAVWMRKAWAGLLRADAEERGVPAREVELVIVAYLVLDEEGKVSFEQRAEKMIWKEED